MHASRMRAVLSVSAVSVVGGLLAGCGSSAADDDAGPVARRRDRPHLPLVCSASTGGLVLVTADLVARTLVPPPEVPVGALTSLVGGPCLLHLLGRRK
ncbi:iron chelate uptake ABC transporter family permease subunit [Streptomyces sp. NPDC005917]|uniref:iron chelate uptake ABC transporter family permease subunit n=1 Tax=unclassified Streptomyces TaxID=2593676 RepID=UPI0033F1A51D